MLYKDDESHAITIKDEKMSIWFEEGRKGNVVMMLQDSNPATLQEKRWVFGISMDTATWYT
jgi:hypothetical protein